MMQEGKNKKKGFLRTHLWDFLLLIGLASGTAGFYAYELTKNQNPSENENLIAEIRIGNSLQKSIQLSNIHEYSTETIEGKHGVLTLGLKHNAIAVIASNCPSQECVREGWVTRAGQPIVCAYNAVLISVVSTSWSEVTVG